MLDEIDVHVAFNRRVTLPGVHFGIIDQVSESSTLEILTTAKKSQPYCEAVLLILTHLPTSRVICSFIDGSIQ